MKNKICTAIATLMLFIPWTILPLRTFDWALESPAAELIIYSYAAFMFRHLFRARLCGGKRQEQMDAGVHGHQLHLCCGSRGDRRDDRVWEIDVADR